MRAHARRWAWAVAPALAALLGPGHARAQDAGLGKNPAAYLAIPSEARSIGMGQARAAACLDAGALSANPASMALAPSHSLVTTSGVLGMDRNYYFLGYLFPFNFRYLGWGNDQARMPMAVAGGVTSFGITGIQARDDFGARQESFDDAERAYHYAFAFSPAPGLGLGFAGKRLTQSLHTASASGESYDAGGHYRLPATRWGTLSLAYAVRNIGGDLGWEVEDDILQTRFAYAEPILLEHVLAASYSPRRDWTFALDMTKVREQGARLHAGAEWSATPDFRLRLGLNHLDPSLGLGYAWKAGGLDLAVDYALQYSLDALHHLHWLTLSFRFWPRKQEAPALREGTPPPPWLRPGGASASE